MAELKKQISIYPRILLAFFIVVSVFSIFARVFSFADNNAYRSFIFALVLTNLILLFLLVIAEFVSLSFDRTASRPTLYATISLFVAHIFSYDFLFFLSFVGVSYPETLERFASSLHLLFLGGGFLFFISVFLENDYSIRHYRLIHLVSFSVLFVANTIFVFTDIFVGSIVVNSVFLVYSIVFGFIYMSGLKGKNNITPGMISILMVVVVSISAVVHVLYKEPANLFGMNILLLTVIPLGYIFIYADFLVKKTRAAYEFEDKSKQEQIKKDHILKVSCFQCFDCFYNDNKVDFISKKSKELFALLIVLRGKTLTMEKAITYLWPDKQIDKSKALYRNAVMKLKQSFAEIGYEGLTFKRGEISLDVSTIDCDYYKVIDKVEKYDGQQLMPEYEWSLELENLL